MNQRTLPAWLWAAVVCLLLVHNVYLWIGQRLAPDSDILALLPVEERDPVLQNAFSKMVESAQQRLIVLVGAGDWAEAGRAADNYLAVLAPHKNLLQADDTDLAPTATGLVGVIPTTSARPRHAWRRGGVAQSSQTLLGRYRAGQTLQPIRRSQTRRLGG